MSERSERTISTGFGEAPSAEPLTGPTLGHGRFQAGPDRMEDQ